MPTVSVILNCYNHESYVAEAVESVLAQSFTDFEVILIDNGSTDGSRAVLDRFDDPRIRRFMHDENLSLSKRLNQGVDVATGEFVCILYSDDMMLPNKLKRQVGLFAGLPAEVGVVYCPAIGLNHWTKAKWQFPSMGLSGSLMPALFTSHFRGAIDMSSPLIRRECLQRYRWYEDLPGDGEAVFFRIALDWEFHWHPEPTVVLRDHGGNWGKAVVRNHEMVKRWLSRLAEEAAFRPAWKADLKCFRAQANWQTAWCVVRSDGDRAWSSRELLGALRRDVRLLGRPRTWAMIGLLLAPRLARRHANRLLDRLRPSEINRVVVP